MLVYLGKKFFHHVFFVFISQLLVKCCKNWRSRQQLIAVNCFFALMVYIWRVNVKRSIIFHVCQEYIFLCPILVEFFIRSSVYYALCDCNCSEYPWLWKGYTVNLKMYNMKRLYSVSASLWQNFSGVVEIEARFFYCVSLIWKFLNISLKIDKNSLKQKFCILVLN